jgi:Zn-dependent metalloprotease
VLDIVAHEAMHGVTFFSVRRRTGAGLLPFLVLDGPGPASVVVGGQTLRCGQAGIQTANRFFPFLCIGSNFATASSHGGAINEGFSDVFGTSVEFFFQRSGTGTLTADYLLGEDVPEIGMASRGEAGPTRSMQNPASLHIDSSRTLRYPDHYSKRLRFAIIDFDGLLLVTTLAFTDTDAAVVNSPDGGAVHWNSTLMSHVFYLAVEGGQNSTSGRTVQGVGAANRDQIERVFFRAMTQLMPSNTTFPTTALLLSQSAVDQFGANSAVARAIDQALAAVGLQ